jgi:hypothetical protein
VPDHSDAAREYERWHSWGGEGIESTRIIHIRDEDLPETLIGMGELHELHIEPVDGDSYILDFTDEPGWASYDPVHENQRIYLTLPRKQRRFMVDDYVDPDGQWWHLNALARAMGGVHATDDYPDVMVQPIGTVSHIVYFTEKKGDGHSQYIHEFGEESGVRPFLAVDKRGRLWLASGNYTSPYEGITD